MTVWYKIRACFFIVKFRENKEKNNLSNKLDFAKVPKKVILV